MIEATPDHRHRIAVFDPDRGLDKEWHTRVHYDVVPTLRTMGSWYFVVSLWDVGKPVDERAFFRHITMSERFLLQGHRAEYNHFANQSVNKFMAGHAYAVPMLGSMLLPMLEIAGASESAQAWRRAVVDLDSDSEAGTPSPKRQRV